MLVQQVMGGQVQWEQWPVYIIAELVAGAAAAIAFGFIAHTAKDGATDDVEATAPAAAVPAEV
jgi:glycerol uptake facilitator protein